MRAPFLPPCPVLVPLLALAVLAGAARAAPAGQDGGDGARELLERSLSEQGIELDLAAGLVSIPAEILIREDLLEYVLVGPRGQTHESLLSTSVVPSVLNTALLALGVEPGTNARWEETGVEDERGRPEHVAIPPSGDGFLLYVAWREDGEVYLFRLEDLVSNLATGRSLVRHRWVFLGSRFASVRPGEEPTFVADAQHNLVNLSFFFDGNTLLTAALPECLEQTIWAPNTWLLPPRGTPVRMIFAREPFEVWPAGWKDALPVHARER